MAFLLSGGIPWFALSGQELAIPERSLLQGRELVEERCYGNRVDCHEEDLQAKDKAPHVDRHHGPRVYQDPCEGCDDWRHDHYAQPHLHQHRHSYFLIPPQDDIALGQTYYTGSRMPGLDVSTLVLRNVVDPQKRDTA